ncbi:MAG: globin [Planctomycetaceae bacterium]
MKVSLNDVFPLPMTGPESDADPETGLRAAFRLVGDDGIARLVAAFYRRVPDDEILAPMYPQRDLAGAEARLRDFLRFRFGDRPDYVERRGHPRLRMRHVPFAIDAAARDRWVALMDAAFEEVDFPPDAERPLRAFLHATATFLVNRIAGQGHR